MIDIVWYSNEPDSNKALTQNGITGSDLVNLLLWTSVSGSIGLLVAFIISILISIKRHWFWINALITFIVTYFLHRLDLLGWLYLKKISWYLGQKFNNSTPAFLLIGTILLSIGLLIFLLKKTNQFIENNKLATV